MDQEFDEDGLPIVPDLQEGEKTSPEREEKIKQRGIKQRELTAKLKKENENLSKGLNADGTPKGDKGKKEDKAGSLDRLDLAVLRTEKITAPEELELVQTRMKESGKTVEQLLESKWFQAELKDLRELNATEEATPKNGTKRSGTSTRDTVDYWLAKDELPPRDQPELRRKVVNAKIAKQKSANQFSQNPVV